MKRLTLVSIFVLGNLLAPGLCASDRIKIEQVLLTLTEQVELPAKEPGVLSDVLAGEGDIVSEGALLAMVENADAQTAVTKMERELDIAKSKAENDVRVRYARTAHQVAVAEYRRAQESVEKFHKSVSATELDQLRLNAEKTQLEIEQAEQEQAIAELTVRQKQCELDAARLKVERHRLVAPFHGMVVEVKKHRQEWVNPGDAVIRLVRLDRLRVEAFVAASQIDGTFQGRRCALSANVAGANRSFNAKISFVSPEVNPVNGQVKLWADVDNSELLLRPGQTVTVVLDRASDIDDSTTEPVAP
jgi:macrolide-specific efflux system membrane fusion protein